MKVIKAAVKQDVSIVHVFNTTPSPLGDSWWALWHQELAGHQEPKCPLVRQLQCCYQSRRLTVLLVGVGGGQITAGLGRGLGAAVRLHQRLELVLQLVVGHEYNLLALVVGKVLSEPGWLVTVERVGTLRSGDRAVSRGRLRLSVHLLTVAANDVSQFIVV